jgi:hypothetical protein
VSTEIVLYLPFLEVRCVSHLLLFQSLFKSQKSVLTATVSSITTYVSAKNSVLVTSEQQCRKTWREMAAEFFIRNIAFIHVGFFNVT